MRSLSRSAFLLSCLHFIFLLFITSPPFLSVAADFLPPSNITLYGRASYRDHSIHLTEHLDSCAAVTVSSSSMGRALFSYPIRFIDTSTNATASFLSRFSFVITPSSPYCSSGDGLAFLIASNPDSFSLSNGYMGLPAPAFEVQDSSYVAVEFDTSFDPKFGDINDNHIGIDLSSIASIVSVDAESQRVDLDSGKKIRAWVEYRDSMKLIRVWIGYSGTRPDSPALSAHIDLSKYFGEFMHVGFSASSGLGSAAHVISHWRFKTVGYGSIPADHYFNLGEENCLMCFPEDMSIEMDGPDRPNYNRDLALGFGGLAALLCSLMLILALISHYSCPIIRKRSNNTENDELMEWNCAVELKKVPARLSLSSIRAATLGFSKNQIIGEGASATVYQGTLPSGRTIAVKRFEQKNRLENCRSPFNTEFGTMVGCLRHKNLVQLQGWCCEGSELVLVYEYLVNGSLDRFLNPKKPTSRSSFFLPWALRKKIVLGVAAALTYLHEECEKQIIHRDVKSCNIMLDRDFNAKLGDFGLAEVYEHSSTRDRDATIPAGTMGYLAPEYVYYGIPTVKTDVYSFGVVVLEVATGRRAVGGGSGRDILVDWVWELWEKGLIADAVDSKLLSGECDFLEVEKMLMVGLCCVHPDPERRPSVREAARVLNGEARVPRIPRKKPRVKFGSVPTGKSEGTGSSSTSIEEMSPGGGGGDETSYMTPSSSGFA